MSLSLIRQPTESFWTTDPPSGVEYHLLSIIVSDTDQYLVAYNAVDDEAFNVTEATVVGGSTFTTAYEALGDGTTGVVFPYISRYTLQGESAPGHSTLYIGQGGSLSAINPALVLSLLGSSLDYRSAPDVQGMTYDETVVDPSGAGPDVTVTRNTTPFDKMSLVPDGQPSLYLAENGVPFLSTTYPTQPQSTAPFGLLTRLSAPFSLYSVPEDQEIITSIIKYCWAPPATSDEWVVTGAAGRLSAPVYLSTTEDPPLDNAYLCLYGGSVGDSSIPIPIDHGSPMVVPNEDGIVVGGAASGYMVIDNEIIQGPGGGWVPFITYPSDIATINPSIGTVNANTTAQLTSYVQLIPMRTIVPAVFTSTDPLFGPYLAEIVTLTVGTDVYPYSPEYQGFALDFSNPSTRALVSATNVTIAGTVTITDTANLLESVSVNGSPAPFSPLSIPLNNIPQIVFTGSTKSGGGGGGGSSTGIVIGGVALFLIIALIIAGIALTANSSDDEN